MARPRISDTQRRVHPVTFWLTPDEFAALSGAAEKAGLRPNDIARRLTVRGERRLIVTVSRRHDAAFIAHLRAIGLNLNQLVHNAHIFGRVSPNVSKLCDDISQLVVAAAVENESGS